MVSGCSSATGQLLKCCWEECDDAGLRAWVQLCCCPCAVSQDTQGPLSSCLYTRNNWLPVIPHNKALVIHFWVLFSQGVPQSGIAFFSPVSSNSTMWNFLILFSSDPALSLPNNHCSVFFTDLPYNTSFILFIILLLLLMKTTLY